MSLNGRVGGNKVRSVSRVVGLVTAAALGLAALDYLRDGSIGTNPDRITLEDATYDAAQAWLQSGIRPDDRFETELVTLPTLEWDRFTWNQALEAMDNLDTAEMRKDKRLQGRRVASVACTVLAMQPAASHENQLAVRAATAWAAAETAAMPDQAAIEYDVAAKSCLEYVQQLAVAGYTITIPTAVQGE